MKKLIMKKLMLSLLLSAGLAAFADTSSVFNENTMAFYAFDDGTVDASALNGTVKNKVDPSKYNGVIHQATGTTINDSYSSSGGLASWSEDRPGKYIFSKGGYKSDLLCVNPGSVSVVDRSLGRGIVCAFDSLASDLGNKGEWTIEWFWKIPSTTVHWTGAHVFRFPLWTTDKNGPPVPQLSLSITAASYFRLHGNSQNSGVAALLNLANATYNNPHNDGLWHHCAISYKNGKATMVFDYKYTASTIQSIAPTNEPIALFLPGTGSFSGIISCIRASSKALSVEDYMVASNDPDCYPRTAFHLDLDGEAGTDSPSLISNRAYATSLAVVNPNQEVMEKYTGFGTYDVDTNGNHSVFCEELPKGRMKRYVVEGRIGDVLGKNLSSLRMPTLPLSVSAPTEAAIWTTGTKLKIGASRLPPVDSSFTMELFAKIDYDSWNENTKYTSGNRRRTTIMGVDTDDGGYYNWVLTVIPSKSGDRITLSAVDVNGDTTSIDSTWSYSLSTGWHHIAVTYDHKTYTLRFYFDYMLQQRLTLQLSAPLRAGKLSSQIFYVGGGLNNHSFDGWMDEVRLVRECLPPEKFLRFRSGIGMSLMIK